MLLVVIIAWLVIVGATSTVVGIRGARTYKRVRTAQTSIEKRVRSLEEGGLASLRTKTEQLAGKTAEMQAALERLQKLARRGCAACSTPSRAAGHGCARSYVWCGDEPSEPLVRPALDPVDDLLEVAAL